MSKLSDLQNRLKQAFQNGQLVLTRDLVDESKIGDFLNGLPETQLPVQLSNQNDIKLSGTTFPQTLSFKGSASDKWPVVGIGEDVFTLSSVTVTFEQNSEESEVTGKLELEGKLAVSATDVLVSGELSENGDLQLGLVSGTGLQINLSEIVDFVTHASFKLTLSNVITLFQKVSIKEFNFVFGFVQTASTLLNFKTEIVGVNSKWDFIPGFKVENLGVNIHAQYANLGGESPNLSFSGNVTGKLKIGQEFDIVMSFQEGNHWELAVYPSSNNLLPGLSDLAGLAGGDSLKQAVQNGFKSLGLDAFSVTAANIGFQLSPAKVNYVSMRGHMQIAGVDIDVQARLPDFQFAGNLSQGSKISVKSIIYHFFFNSY